MKMLFIVTKPPCVKGEDWGHGGDKVYTVGDFIGDGKKDLAYWDRNTGEIFVALSDGMKFMAYQGVEDQIWLKDFALGNKWQVQSGDFNGNGADDIVAYDESDGKWEFAHSNRKQFIMKSWQFPGVKMIIPDSLPENLTVTAGPTLHLERHFGKKTVIDSALSVINKGIKN